MIPSVKGEFPHVIDSTIRAEFVSCQTKGYYSFVRSLGPPEPSIDLIAGGAFAKGLEVLRLRFYGDGKNLQQSLEEGMMAAIVEYGDVDCPEHKQQKSIQRVVEALAFYVETWPPATDHLQPYMVNGKPSVEYTFSVPIPINHPVSRMPLIYAGRFDMVALYRQQLVGDDEKTTSQLGPTWVNKWNLRGQFTGYCWALHQFNIPVIGMVVRGISFLKTSFGSAEALQMRSNWQIQQWYEQLLRDVQRAVDAYNSDWYDQDFNETCAEYGGCPFQSLCLSANPENWVAGKFSFRQWDPLKKVPYVQPEQKIEVIDAPELKRFLNP